MSILFKLLNALTTENQNSNTPLTFTANSQSDIVLTYASDTTNKEVYVKLNDNEWQLYDFSWINLESGDTVQFENKSNEFSIDSNTYYQFQIGGEVYASGNLLSLINYSTDVPNYAFINLFKECTGLYQAPMIPATSVGRQAFHDTFASCSNLQNCPDLPAMTISDYCYWGMFFNCTSLTKIPASLPATQLAQHCYDGMFNGCESLTTMPILPATTLANYCYSNMFERCYRLQYTASLPATTLADYCYNAMFYKCTGLIGAPELTANTLSDYCYQQMFEGCTNLQFPPSYLPADPVTYRGYRYMFKDCSSLDHSPEIFAETFTTQSLYGMFYGCSSLERIHVHFTSWPTTNYMMFWVNGVKSSGTFIKPTDLPEQFGPSRIPTGWTIENF